MVSGCVDECKLGYTELGITLSISVSMSVNRWTAAKGRRRKEHSKDE